MGIIVGLVLVLVAGAVVTGVVIWRKKRSGREGSGDLSLLVSLGFQAQVEICSALFLGRPLHTHVLSLGLSANTYPSVKHMWK